jgi:LysM repeat protein
LLPSTPAAQQQLEKLADQNRQLQAQVDHLNDIVKQWDAWYAAQQAAARTNPTPAVQYTPEPQQQTPVATQQQSGGQSQSSIVSSGSESTTHATPATRTHVVASGETAMRIARKAGVSFTALQAANPGVNLSRIHSGQILNLPSP